MHIVYDATQHCCLTISLRYQPVEAACLLNHSPKKAFPQHCSTVQQCRYVCSDVELQLRIKLENELGSNFFLTPSFNSTCSSTSKATQVANNKYWLCEMCLLCCYSLKAMIVCAVGRAYGVRCDTQHSKAGGACGERREEEAVGAPQGGCPSLPPGHPSLPDRSVALLAIPVLSALQYS